MAIALRKTTEADNYHGFPVLPLRVDDPIPAPQAPERYALRVYPDLARYLLTFNHPNNRNVQARTVRQWAADMRDGLWRLIPGGLVFTGGRVLNDGQHRLHAVIEYGGDVWFLADFGWPDEIIHVIDRNKPRSNADSFRIIGGVASATTVASTISKVELWKATVGTTRTALGGGIAPPSSARALEIYDRDPEFWQAAVRAGDAIYRAMDKGYSSAIWGACFAIIEEAGPGRAAPFYAEVREGTGAPRSASRVLADWVRRRPVTATRTQDPREPMELVIRAFNAWESGKPLAFPRGIGFTLSHVR